MAEENDKSTEMLERAIEIFSDRGNWATSMKDLAEQVNPSKSTMYYYFRSKQDLLVAIYRGVIGENIVAGESIYVSGPAAEALRQILTNRVAYTCHNRSILQIFYEEAADPKRLSDEVVKISRAYQEILV